MTTSETAGFWSYAHRDNEADGGRLLRLVHRVREEFELLTGNDLTIFVDRTDIAWGDEWRKRINEALQSTTFFIAVITPRYLRSPECRRELLAFVGKAESLGLRELFLPIVYTPIRQLDEGENSQDEIVTMLSRTQYVDWRKLRLLDEQSAEYRGAVNALASRLVDIAERLEENPPELPSYENLSDTLADEDELGLVDILANAEQAFPVWGESIAGLAECLHELEALATPMQERVNESDAKGKGFAGRLLVLRDFAEKLDPLADRMTSISHQYATQIVEIDPAMQIILRELAESTEEANSEQALEFIAGMEELTRGAEAAMGPLRELVTTLNQAKGLSRDLRKPLRKLSDALRSLLDSHAVMEDWTTRIRATQKSLD
ncbi:toll/interleukin-1 receptor domain-containing protein [Microbispora rosea]|uniref:toll/interleukin-1 receptor domain-containing protein n=1 Tax=Microbispora rosea TaxID=58117 RepID=UPI0009DCF7C3|nr:toll/interleukin-1 receptor domain-containing protein [Microbispora rosea]